MLGKISKVTVGVTVGLVAAAPLAWAGGTGYGDDTDVAGAKDGGHGGHSKHDDGWGDKDDHGHFSGKVCSFDGGNGEAASLISGDSLANAVAQAPIAGNNIANIANCSDFLNNNGNGNFSGNQVAVGSGLLP